LPGRGLGRERVVYICINKNGTRYHIFGTHLQADEPSSGGVTSRMIRRSQMQKIKRFIDSKNIPANEAVIIAGDLNVDMYGSKEEYSEMLQILSAAHPTVEGYPWSFDRRLNDLGEYGGSRKLLIMYSFKRLLN
jgi:phospholipase C